MNKMKKYFAILLLLSTSAMVTAFGDPSVSAEASAAALVLCQILQNLRFILTVIAAAIGIIIIVLQGIKWVGSADDPGARKQAKQGIIHAIIGMIIVVLAVVLVTMVMTGDYCGTNELM